MLNRRSPILTVLLLFTGCTASPGWQALPEPLPGLKVCAEPSVPSAASRSLLQRIEAVLGPERVEALKNATDIRSITEGNIDATIKRVVVNDDDPMLGDRNAPVTIVVWSDFQCGFCGRHAANIRKLLKEFPNGFIRVVFKQFPLPYHPHSMTAAMVSLAAHEQGKFWPMYDALFFEHGELSEETMAQLASEAGIDLTLVFETVKSGRLKERVLSDMRQGESVGVEGTPTSFFNGVCRPGAASLDTLKSYTLLALARAWFLLRQGVPPEKIYETIISYGE